MFDLPHRFVPTTCRVLNPARLVAQDGHDSEVDAVAFSPCRRFFVSADKGGCVKFWSLDTLDILGSYLIGFVCKSLKWEGLRGVLCEGDSQERRIDFDCEEEDLSSGEVLDNSRLIRLIDEPEIDVQTDGFDVLYNGETFHHPLQGLIRAEMEVCERYAVAVAPSELLIVSIFDGSSCVRLSAQNDKESWLDFHISSRGDFVVGLTQNGSVWIGDPMKGKMDRVFCGKDEVTAYDFGKDDLIIWGNRRGNISVYSVAGRRLVFQSPRCSRGFCAVFPSPEKIGLMALRTESVTAYLGLSREILSAAPLPAAYRASCAGSVFSEMLVACADQAVYRIWLDQNRISKEFQIPENASVEKIASGRECVLMYLSDGRYLFHNGKRFVDLPGMTQVSPRCLAVSENGKMLASLGENGVSLVDVSGKLPSMSVAVSDGVQVCFGREKTASQLFVFKASCDLVSIDCRTGEILWEQSLSAVENARMISLAPASKSYVFALVESDHGQLLIVKVGLNTGKSSIVQRIYTVGTQIWAASDDGQSVHLREDAQCLRIVSGGRSFSPVDWYRSEPYLERN